jgi:hypothetical protein
MPKYFQLTYCNFTKLNLTSRKKVRCSTECFCVVLTKQILTVVAVAVIMRQLLRHLCNEHGLNLALQANPVAVPLTSASVQLQVPYAVLWNNLVLLKEFSQYHFFIRIHTILPRNCAVITSPNPVDITARLVIYVTTNPPERSGSCVLYIL